MSADDRELLRGAMRAQDEREMAAGARCGVPYEQSGCDWPDAVAEAVLARDRKIAELEACEKARTPGYCAQCGAIAQAITEPRTIVYGVGEAGQQITYETIRWRCKCGESWYGAENEDHAEQAIRVYLHSRIAELERKQDALAVMLKAHMTDEQFSSAPGLADTLSAHDAEVRKAGAVEALRELAERAPTCRFVTTVRFDGEESKADQSIREWLLDEANSTATGEPVKYPPDEIERGEVKR